MVPYTHLFEREHYDTGDDGNVILVLVVGVVFVSFLEISCVCLNFLDSAGGQNFQNQLQKNRFSFQISLKGFFGVARFRK